MLPTQDTISRYHIYVYTFLDDLSFIQDPFACFQDEDSTDISDAIHLVGEKFKEYGWEGDGTIGVIWLPPFVDVGIHDTHGNYIWHVKQYNNGISFLACDTALDFERLNEQNNLSVDLRNRDNVTAESIIETYVNLLFKQIQRVRGHIDETLQFLSECSLTDTAESIRQDILVHNQGILVRSLHELLDECYLQILIRAIGSGNPHNIKLRKSNVRIDTSKYLPDLNEDDDNDSNTGDASHWFTVRGLISDMWKAYKWEPFNDKTSMLFKSVDYPAEEACMYEIRKHVILRNCIQHHEGGLDRDSLKQLGREELEIRTDQNSYMIKAWEAVILHENEIYHLCDMLLRFANEFHEHIRVRIPELVYRYSPARQAD